MKPATREWTDHHLALIALRQLSVLVARAMEVLDRAPSRTKRGLSEEDARSWMVMEKHLRMAAVAAAMVRHRHGEPAAAERMVQSNATQEQG